MQGDKGILHNLNLALTQELTAINQHFLHARMFGNWGLQQLDATEYRESIRKMKDADRLIERILFLGGLPNLQSLDKLLLGEHTEEMLQGDLQLRLGHVTQLREFIRQAEDKQDFVSRELLEDILGHAEDFIDWLETQLALIQAIGSENYQQSMMG